MKVLMIVHGFAPECSGGTESYVLRLCKELMRRKHDVAVLCGSHEGAGPEAVEPRMESTRHLGIPVHRIHRTGLYVDNWEKGLAPEVLPLLDEVLRSFEPDLVHVHHWIRLTRNLIEHCHDRGVPAVCTLHDLSASCGAAFRVHNNRFCEPTPEQPHCWGCPPLGEYMDADESRVEWEHARMDFACELSLARRLIVPSNAHKKILLMEHPRLAGRFRVVQHGNIAAFKRRRFERSRQEGRFPDGPLVLGHWGHLSFAKGIDVLVEAVAGLRDPERVRVEVFGPMVYPRERERIERLSEELPFNWRGVYKPADLRRVPMDLAVIPSRCSESWSFVLDEAFLLGLPALVSDRGALSERIDGAGRAFRPADPRDLRHVIEDVLADPELLGQWGRRIPELPTMAEHAASIERVYREVTTSAAPLPTTPLDVRTERLTRKVRQLEIRNRQHEENAARIENLEGDLRCASDTMDEMGFYHRKKDAELTRLNGEIERVARRITELDAEARHAWDEKARAEERLTRYAETRMAAFAREKDALIERLEHDSRTRLSDLDEEVRTAKGSQEELRALLSSRAAQVNAMAKGLDDLLHQMESLERRRRSAALAAARPNGGWTAGRDERLKILMVVHQFVPRHVAGTEVYTHDLACELARGNDVVILTAESDHSRPRFEESRHVIDGLPVRQVIHNYKWSHFRETYDCPEADAIFRRVLKEERPDVVHVQHLHYWSANFITIARSQGIPVVYTLHDYIVLCARDGIMRRADGEICAQPIPAKCAECIAENHEPAKLPAPPLPRGLKPGADALLDGEVVRLTRRLRHGLGFEVDPFVDAATGRLDYLERVLEDVDLFVSPSRFLRRKFIESGMIATDKIIYSDNGIDVGRFPQAEPRRLPPADRLRVGYVGTIAEHKGLDVLVEAMNRIDDERIHCHVWGELKAFVEYTAHLEALVQNPRTLLMGAFQNDRISDVLANLDVLVIPSLWYENSPLTVHEAALAGLPVIASNIGGLAEYVQNGVTGLLFETGSAEALAATLMSCFESPGPLARFDPSALVIKPIAQDARDTEARYRGLLQRVRAGR